MLKFTVSCVSIFVYPSLCRLFIYSFFFFYTYLRVFLTTSGNTEPSYVTAVCDQKLSFVCRLLSLLTWIMELNTVGEFRSYVAVKVQGLRCHSTRHREICHIISISVSRRATHGGSRSCPPVSIMLTQLSCPNTGKCVFVFFI